MFAPIRYAYVLAWSTLFGFASYFAIWTLRLYLTDGTPGVGDEALQSSAGLLGTALAVFAAWWGLRLGGDGANWLLFPLRLVCAVVATVATWLLLILCSVALFSAQVANLGWFWLLLAIGGIGAAVGWFNYFGTSTPHTALVQAWDDFHRLNHPRGRFLKNLIEERLRDAREQVKHLQGPELMSEARVMEAATKLQSDIEETLDPEAPPGHPARQSIHVCGPALPGQVLETGVLVLAKTGAGKGAELNYAYRDALNWVARSAQGSGSRDRAILFDYQGNSLVQVHRQGLMELVDLINPMDRRTKWWALGKDMHHVLQTHQFPRSIFPEEMRGRDDFWNKSASAIVDPALQGLVSVKGNDTELRDLVLLLSRAEDTVEILRRNPSTSSTADMYYSGKASDTKWGILLTIEKEIRRLSVAAALLHLAKTRGAPAFSVSDWMSGGRILTLGFSRAYASSMRPLSHLLFELATREVLQYSEHTDGEPQLTWCLMDEAVQLGRLDVLPELLRGGRQKGFRVFFAAQDVPSVEEIYGRESAASNLSSFGVFAFGRTEDPRTAQFMSDVLGKRIVTEDRRSIGERRRTFQPTSHDTSTTERAVERPVVPPHKFTEYSRFGTLRTYCKAQGVGLWERRLLLSSLRRDFPPFTREELHEVAFQEVDLLDITLTPWSNDERRALGLPLVPETLPSPNGMPRPRPGLFPFLKPGRGRT